MSMRILHSLPATFTLLCALAPPAAAQTLRLDPRVEVGADVSAALHDSDPADTRGAAGARVTVHLSPRTALSFFGEVAATKHDILETSWEDARLAVVEVRRVVHRDRIIEVQALAGGGIAVQRIFRDAFVVPDRTGFVTRPASSITYMGWASTLGLGVREQLNSRLAARQDIRFVLANPGTQLQLQAGVDVALGRPASSVVAGAATYGSTTLRTGQYVWITDASGRELEGTVGAIDGAGLEVLTTTGRAHVASADLARIQLPDSVKEGARRGAIVGAAGLTGFVVFIVSALSEGEEIEWYQVAAVSAGYGAGIGAVTGMWIDSLIDGRRTIFDRGPAERRVTMVPTVGARRIGLGASVSW